ncbi:hypothetical protein WJX73_006518 [Symbiochloris irregularis]|uniref:BAG domain-containing protein n=1 Tax=Symbiochloris irregularis TaxID=706552 RepID=A0AAW1NGZ0_9CHLO
MHSVAWYAGPYSSPPGSRQGTPPPNFPSPRQSHFDATPHTSPRPGSSPAPGAQRASPPPQPPPSIMERIAQVSGKVDELAAKAEGLLQQPVQDKKALRLVEEQFTQQLLALDSLDVNSDERLARKAQINRINAWADRLESLRTA